jgi:hypothetical protein
VKPEQVKCIWQAGGVGAVPLVVMLNSGATPAAVLALVRAVAYANVSPTPLTAPRWARFALTDETGLVSNLAIKTVVNTAVPQVFVQGVVVNDGNAQRSVVRSLTVTFSGPVTFAGDTANAAAAFRLARTSLTGPTGNVDLHAAVMTDAQGRTVVTLTFSGSLTEQAFTAAGANPSLIDGLYTLTVFGSAVTGPGGLNLDGDHNGTPGGDNTFNLHRLFGDVDGDRDVDADDIFGTPGHPGLIDALFASGPLTPQQAAFDFEGDGDVDADDLLSFFVPRLFTTV